MSNCRGCGSLLDLTDEQISRAVDDVLESTRTDVTALGRVCPLCGHPTSEPVSHRKSVQFTLLVGVLALMAVLVAVYYAHRDTVRQQAVQQALEQLQSNADVTRYLGTPITMRGDVTGQAKQDETGWHEVRLTMPLRGPAAEGVAQVVGGRATGRWQFTTFEVVIASARKRVDLVAGRVTDYDPQGYVEVHTQTASTPEYLPARVPAPRWDGRFPCITAQAAPGSAPWVGDCPTQAPFAALDSGPLDRFEVDLRYGKFVLRQTDLLVTGDVQVPFTRTYTSEFWAHGQKVNAFGVHSTHHFDVAPVGSRNPYTYLMLVLPDNDHLYFPRISRGSGYANAVYQHTETSSAFYKATIRWDGGGWDTRLADGSRLVFPESYSARNMAQGAAVEMTDAKGNTLRLIRDPQRNLQEIRAPGGRWLKLSYDGRARVVRAWNDRDQVVDYRYDAEGMLADVRYSDGRSRHYTYDGSLLVSVRDEKDRLLIRNQYRAGRLAQQEYSNGESCRIRYTLSQNRHYADEATIAFSNGATRSIRTGDSVPEWLTQLARSGSGG